jgi:hypothetical protein
VSCLTYFFLHLLFLSSALPACWQKNSSATCLFDLQLWQLTPWPRLIRDEVGVPTCTAEGVCRRRFGLSRTPRAGESSGEEEEAMRVGDSRRELLLLLLVLLAGEEGIIVGTAPLISMCCSSGPSSFSLKLFRNDLDARRCW